MPRTCAPVSSRWRWIASLSMVVLALAATTALAQGTKAMTFEDLMKFRAIQRPVIADDGSIVAFGAQPDRGDGEGVVHALAGGQVFRVPRGSAPVIFGDSRLGRHGGQAVVRRGRARRQDAAQTGHGAARRAERRGDLGGPRRAVRLLGRLEVARLPAVGAGPGEGR